MRLSIITINKNNAAGLEKTIQSVVAQTFDDFEYIVIDGNSNDGSVEIIKKYADNLDYCISENDSGIYNAMNKGIRKAQGDFCLFLNSGDYLIKQETLAEMFAEIAFSDEADIYYSNCRIDGGRYDKFPLSMDVFFFIQENISHQNSIIRRSLFLMHGFYNEAYTIVSDWEFYLKEIYLYKSSFIYIKTDIAVYDLHGISFTMANQRENEKEKVFKDVFKELSEPIIFLYKLQENVYWDIIKKYGNTKLLDFILKIYRYIVKRVRKKTDARSTPKNSKELLEVLNNKP
jgi:glycosyltransferase involved in cell wall biosynthesis